MGGLTRWVESPGGGAGKFLSQSGQFNPAPWDDFWYEPVGRKTLTGARVNQETAESIAAIDAATCLIADTVSSLPIPIYRRAPNGIDRTPVPSNPLWSIINTQPNGWQTAVDFWSNRLIDLLFWGNGYAEIRTGTNFVESLLPLQANRMEVRLDPDGSIIYKYKDPQGPPRFIDEDLMFHIRSGQSRDNGITGIGLLHKHIPNLSLQLAVQIYSEQLYGQGTMHMGVLQHPGAVGELAQERLRKQWAQNQGLGAAGKPLFLEEGMVWQPTSMTPENAQVIESRKFHVEEACRMVRVPPHLIGHTEKNSSWGTGMADLTAGFLKFTLRPWLHHIQQAISRDLIGRSNLFFPEYDVQELLRADIKTRYEVYSIGRQWGILTSNEVRRKENMPPVEGGDELYMPGTMQPSTGAQSGEFALGRTFIKDVVNRSVRNEVHWLENHLASDFSDHERMTKIEAYFSKRIKMMQRDLHISETDAEEHARYSTYTLNKAIESGEEAEVVREWAMNAERRLMTSIYRTIQ